MVDGVALIVIAVVTLLIVMPELVAPHVLVALLLLVPPG
jgi:hypothetical protein